MAKLTKKKLESLIEASYVKHAQGKQISIMKIGNVFKDAAKAVLESAGPTGEVDVQAVLDKAMPEIVARYCEPV